MSSIPVRRPATDPYHLTQLTNNEYPTSDGKPMAETDLHRVLMTDLILTLQAFYATMPSVYVSGNLLLFYEAGNKRRHISPDVFVVFGVGNYLRPNYLLWEEGQPPRFVIELTSKTTRRADITTKMALYRDVLKVREYFLFDPYEDYLSPSLQGFRLRGGTYQTIRMVDNRLPSQTTGLHLERQGDRLRLWNPATQALLPTPAEAQTLAEQQRNAAEQQGQAAEQQRQIAEQQRQAAEQQRQAAEQQRQAAENEVARLRRLLEQSGISLDEPR